MNITAELKLTIYKNTASFVETSRNKLAKAWNWLSNTFKTINDQNSKVLLTKQRCLKLSLSADTTLNNLIKAFSVALLLEAQLR